MKQRLTVPVLWLLVCAGVPTEAVLGQGQGRGEGGIDELKAALERPGPEAAEARQAAIENLLAMLDLRGHGVLQEKLRGPLGPDGLHKDILVALARRLGNPGDKVFGTGSDNREARQQVVRSYVPVLVPFWLPPAPGTEAAVLPLRELARGCVTRMPMRELEEGLKTLVALPTQDAAMQTAAMAVAADCQNLYLTGFLAEHLGHADARIRTAARRGLKLLTFVEEEFSTAEQFREWWKKNDNKRYLDLAEEAARGAFARVQRLESEGRARLVQGNVDLVLALADNRSGIDWAAVQARVLSDDPPGTTEACLDRLRQRLQDEPHTDNNTRDRHAFQRALVDALAKTPPANVRLRTLLLETAAFLLRPGEGEPAAEMERLLIGHLEGSEPALVLAAVRGLRRLPSMQARAAVVRLARTAVDAVDGNGGTVALLREALRTLGRRGNPAWTAPAEGDADKHEWLALVRAVFAADRFKELRAEAMVMALLPDAKGERVPEVFDALLALAKDPQQSYEVRSASLVHLKDFLAREERADTFVREVAALLADPEQELRLFAANQLVTLPVDHAEARRREWVGFVLRSARERVRVETDPGVLRALLSCVVGCARPPGTVGEAVQSLIWVLENIGHPVPTEHLFRVEPVLTSLTALAAEPSPEAGPWLGACRVLLLHENRRRLRHVLQSQHAVRLAPDTTSPDSAKVENARRAMHFILRTAALKPLKESWTAPELRDEASDVRSAFAALDAANADLDAPNFRMLRLEVLSALGANQEVLQHGGRWLSPEDKPRSGGPLSAEQKDGVRLLCAEAQLALGQPDKAGALLNELDPARGGEPGALALMERLGRAYLDAGASQKAVGWLDRAFRGTGEGDARYRYRLLALVQARLLAEPGARADLVAMLDSKAGLFEAADCPQELKEAYLRLRGGQ